MALFNYFLPGIILRFSLLLHKWMMSFMHLTTNKISLFHVLHILNIRYILTLTEYWTLI